MTWTMSSTLATKMQEKLSQLTVARAAKKLLQPACHSHASSFLSVIECMKIVSIDEYGMMSLDELQSECESLMQAGCQ